MSSEEIKMDEKVTVYNIADWDCGFNKVETVGSANIPKNGSARFSRAEIIAQAQKNNKLFCGIDGMGSHATFYIDDEVTRKYLEYDTDDYKQNVLSKEKIEKIFALKTLNAFKKNMIESIKTRAEKSYVLHMISVLKINEYDKIMFAKDYCKFNLY